MIAVESLRKSYIQKRFLGGIFGRRAQKTLQRKKLISV